MKKIALMFTTFALMVGCRTSSKTDAELDELFMMMQGSFSSEQQAAKDSAYYYISLHMYPIWEDRGHFLYVEQALHTLPDRPYRQRIFELRRVDQNTLSSHSYVLPNDTLWVGKWKTPEAFDDLRLDDLKEREGCELRLVKQDDGSFKGSTGDKTCESSLLGAAYATSQVVIDDQKLISWDRGFDKEGNQVWGAEKGGYIFDKIVMY
ncbi:chromophore lyase CpcT/CpeT [Sungkyunkwania multivorans]|uniref:Chromophore lyase CpcT/CpeT n=1 Tax=Sungkyunkwania multivorans TaxID=1173618 RepID=A0ABW3CV59_9FLAO